MWSPCATHSTSCSSNPPKPTLCVCVCVFVIPDPVLWWWITQTLLSCIGRGSVEQCSPLFQRMVKPVRTCASVRALTHSRVCKYPICHSAHFQPNQTNRLVIPNRHQPGPSQVCGAYLPTFELSISLSTPARHPHTYPRSFHSANTKHNFWLCTTHFPQQTNETRQCFPSDNPPRCTGRRRSPLWLIFFGLLCPSPGEM